MWHGGMGKRVHSRGMAASQMVAPALRQEEQLQGQGHRQEDACVFAGDKVHADEMARSTITAIRTELFQDQNVAPPAVSLQAMSTTALARCVDIERIGIPSGLNA